MVKVTVEYEEQKDKFEGEFFMGFTISHIGNIGDASAFKAGGTAIGKTDKRCLPKNTALCIADIFKRTYADPKEYAAALLDASDVLTARAKEVVASKLDKSVAVIQAVMKGEDDGGKH